MKLLIITLYKNEIRKTLFQNYFLNKLIFKKFPENTYILCNRTGIWQGQFILIKENHHYLNNHRIAGENKYQ